MHYKCNIDLYDYVEVIIVFCFFKHDFYYHRTRTRMCTRLHISSISTSLRHLPPILNSIMCPSVVSNHCFCKYVYNLLHFQWVGNVTFCFSFSTRLENVSECIQVCIRVYIERNLIKGRQLIVKN